MKITGIVEALVEAGATPAMILAAVRSAEEQKDGVVEAGKEKARARWRKWKGCLALSASDWMALRAAVLDRDNFTCVYCGSRGTALSPLHVDHVLPLSRGGTNDPDNLVAACRECNCGKSGRTVEEWRG